MSREFELSRRKILSAVGGVGLASVGAGMGTTAFLNDTESFEGNSMTAGELDLKVDWTEHYSDWSDDEKDGVTVSMTDDSLQYGFPSAAGAGNKLVYVDNKDKFLANTAIETFPDIDPSIRETDISKGDYDGQQFSYQNDDYICDIDADLDAVLSSAYRTGGKYTEGVEIGDAPNAQTTARGDPLVDISDVKPGDFGEVTFSIHLCGNPGYVWLTGDFVDANENGNTQPEGEDEDEIGPSESHSLDLFPNEGDEDSSGTTTQEPVELLDAISAAVWYDTGMDGDYGTGGSGEGDNYHQQGEAFTPLVGSLRNVLQMLESMNVPLDYSPGSDSGSSGIGGSSSFDVCSSLSEALTDEGPFEVLDPEGGTKIIDVPFTNEELNFKSSRNIKCEELDETYSSQNIAENGTEYCGTKFEEDGGVLADGEGQYAVGPGTITIESVNVSGGTITLSTDFPVENVGVKGGNQGELNYLFETQGGTEGDDEQFGCILDEVTFHTPTNDNDVRAAISNLDVCYDPNIPGDGGGSGQGNGRECFPNSTTGYIGFEWWVPTDVGNEIQGDSVSFDLGFYTEQCRHNENPSEPS